MKTEKINHLSVLVLVLIQQVIGAVWYSPFVFGKLWLASVEKDFYLLKAMGGYPHFISALSSFLVCYFLVWLIKMNKTSSAVHGAKLGFLTWCGAIVPVTCTHYVYAAASTVLIFINIGYSLSCFVISGALLALWNKD